MQITYTKVPPKICRQNRDFYKNHVRKAFVMWCAYEGLFDECFTKAEIKKAKKGVLPDDCNVHHKIPLSGSNELFVNDFTNLTILHQRTHEYINKYIFAPQLRQIQNEPYGTEIRIDVPKFGYVDVEGIKKERMILKTLFYNRRRKNGRD